MEHAERFTGRVADYERYRSRYPAAVIDVLRERCGLQAADVIADIGAGTGMLAEMFLAGGNRVIAVEPNADMRSACEHLRTRFPALVVVNAAAENTGLASASIDLVSVGRAFHWFDQERAIAEFKRILKPGGWVVLASMRRAANGSEQTLAYEDVLRRHGKDYDKLHGKTRTSEGLRRYAGEDFRVSITGEQIMTLDELEGETRSYSIAPQAGDAEYPAMQTALGEFFARWSQGGLLTMQTQCEIAGWRSPE